MNRGTYPLESPKLCLKKGHDMFIIENSFSEVETKKTCTLWMRFESIGELLVGNLSFKLRNSEIVVSQQKPINLRSIW